MKLLTIRLAIVLLIGSLITLSIYCSKKDAKDPSLDPTESISVNKNPNSKTLKHKSERSLYNIKSGSLPKTSSMARTGTFGCGATLSDEYIGEGGYEYENFDLKFSDNVDYTVRLNCVSYETPNRFTVYDSQGNEVVSSEWIGFAEYNGPWGESLDEVHEMEISFTASKGANYSLTVETYTDAISDFFEVKMECDLSETQAYDILNSSASQNFANLRNQFLDKVSFAFSKGNSVTSVRNAFLLAAKNGDYSVVDTMAGENALIDHSVALQIDHPELVFFFGQRKELFG